MYTVFECAHVLLFADGLFNADCSVAHLLHAIKQKLKIPLSGMYRLQLHQIYDCHGHKICHFVDTIDLCTPEGDLKQLYCHKDDNGAKYFTLRELCLTVRVEG